MNYQNRPEGLTVIGASCIQRMQKPLQDKRPPPKDLKKVQCQNRVRNWPNTLEAQRQKKEGEQFAEFERNELRLREIDEEEAGRRQAEREEQLQRANQQIFEKDPRVQQLKGKMLLSEAHQVRDMQGTVKQRMTQMDKLRDQQIAEQHEQIMRKQNKIERERAERSLSKKKEFQAALRQQAQEVVTQHVKEYQMDLIEGQLTKNKNQEALLQEQKKQREIREKNKALAYEYTQDWQKRDQYAQEERKKHHEEQVQIDNWVERKDKITRMKAQRDRQMASNRQKRIDGIFANNEALMVKQQVDQESLLQKHDREVREKESKREQEKQQKIIALKAETRRFNDRNISRKEAEREQQKREDQDYQAFWKNKNVQIYQEEEQRKQEIFRQNKELQQEQRAQAEQKQREREALVIEELEEAQVAQTNNALEERHYRNWAEKAIKEWEGQGKNITPMLLTLQKQMKAL